MYMHVCVLVCIKFKLLNRICRFHKNLKKHFVQEIDIPIH